MTALASTTDSSDEVSLAVLVSSAASSVSFGSGIRRARPEVDGVGNRAEAADASAEKTFAGESSAGASSAGAPLPPLGFFS